MSDIFKEITDEVLVNEFVKRMVDRNKELQKELDHLKEQIKIAESYCEVYVADIQKANKIIAEAIEVIKSMKDDLFHEGMTKYEGYLKAEDFLKARGE